MSELSEKDIPKNPGRTEHNTKDPLYNITARTNRLNRLRADPMHQDFITKNGNLPEEVLEEEDMTPDFDNEKKDESPKIETVDKKEIVEKKRGNNVEDEIRDYAIKRRKEGAKYKDIAFELFQKADVRYSEPTIYYWVTHPKKKKRGRPSKNEKPTVKDTETIEEKPVVKRKPGRPKKEQTEPEKPSGKRGRKSVDIPRWRIFDVIESIKKRRKVVKSDFKKHLKDRNYTLAGLDEASINELDATLDFLHRAFGCK